MLYRTRVAAGCRIFGTDVRRRRPDLPSAYLGNIRQETVAAARNGLNKARIVRRIAERVADLVDCLIEAVIEVNNCLRPQLQPQLLPRHQFSRFLQQYREQLKRLLLERQDLAQLCKFSRTEIGFKYAESQSSGLVAA